MSNFIIQILRTLVPLVVGWVVAQLSRIGLAIPDEVAAETVPRLTVLVSSLYYLGVVGLERKWPWFGWPLGVARNPMYEAKPKRTATN